MIEPSLTTPEVVTGDADLGPTVASEGAIEPARAQFRQPYLTWVFSAAALASSLLLFWVEPLFTKTLLPFLGGAPLVWNTAVLFFQFALLAGYGYVYFSGRWLSPRVQVWVHLGLLLTALAFLPFAVPGTYSSGGNPIFEVLKLLSLSVGFPIFVVSATAPLVQRWFAATDAPDADDPYFLYSASNIGSILALGAFPFILEPLFTLGQQRRLWSVGFVFLAFTLVVCASAMLRSRKNAAPLERRSDFVSLPWRMRLKWMLLSAVPASLLLGVTQHITTDVASVPLLWIAPLLVYLLTFVIAFSRKRPVLDRWVYQGQVFFLVVAGILIWAPGHIYGALALHLGILFALALACHWTLSNSRPTVEGLTQFYVYLSLGGLIGGAFNTIIAPLVFDNVFEYGLAAAAACMLRPGSWSGRRRDCLFDWIVPITMFCSTFGLLRFVGNTLPDLFPHAFILMILVFTVVGFGFKDRPLRFGLTVAAFLFVGSELSGDVTVIKRERSYFGSYKVVFSERDNANLLFHGTTIHGVQLLDSDRITEPTSYYARKGPLGQAFAALRPDTPQMSVGLVGLGIGSALCFAEPGDDWHVFEIDPLVAELAANPEYFHQWDECGQGAHVTLSLGDARLSLQDTDATFDVLILDAYTSDAIPIHLITREALDLYRKRLRPHGVLLFHISNRHMSLDRILAALAGEAQMAAVIQEYQPAEESSLIRSGSMWVALAEEPKDLSLIGQSGGWVELSARNGPVWTDDYSNIISVLR